MKRILKIVFLGIFSAILFSCKVTKKITSSVQTDSTAISVRDSLKLSKKDSVASQTKDSAGTSVNKKRDNIHIEFDNADTSKYKSPVRITDSGNTIIIDAGGRKLKSIDKDSESEKKDSTVVKASTATRVSQIDSAGKKQLDSTALKKQIKTKEVTKQTDWRWLLLEVLGSVAAIFGLVYLFGNYKVSLLLAPPYVSLKKKLK